MNEVLDTISILMPFIFGLLATLPSEVLLPAPMVGVAVTVGLGMLQSGV